MVRTTYTFLCVYDRFLVFQYLQSNGVFIILTDSQQETANLFKFRDTKVGGVYSIAEPMFRGMMGDGAVKIVRIKEYLVPTDSGPLSLIMKDLWIP